MGQILKRAAQAALGVSMAVAPVAAQSDYAGYETPRYTVERVMGDVELRAYNSYIVAEVTVRGAQSGALSQGFSVLAGYIFGGNTAAASVDMTSPVAQRPSQQIAMTSPVGQTGTDGLWTVTFTMPSEYTLATLPTPNSAAVRFVEVAPAQQLVLRFSGRAGTAMLNDKTAALRKFAAAEGIAITGAPAYYFYDAPMTLPWNRRNEVAFCVANTC